MTRNDVLIIGAGPSGLFAAGELARHGVSVRLIERELKPHRQARATTIQPGTLEILDSVGLLPPFLEASEYVRRSRLYGPDMTELRSLTLRASTAARCPVPDAVADPVPAALLRNARAMIDVDYVGSPLVADCVGTGDHTAAEPHPGQRYRDWTRFGGTSHHVLVFGPEADGEGSLG